MQDLRLAFRALSATPLVSTVAVLTLALGIGANTAIFSVANGLLLRPLPVAEPAKLVTVTSEMALGRGYTAGAGWTYAMWTRLRDRAASFDGAFAMRGQRLDLAERGESQPVDGVYVSGDYFRTLGVRTLAGRIFTIQDDVRGGGPDGPVVVISYSLWQRRFGGSAAIIGAPLSINGTPFTVVGVTPPAFTGVEVGRTFDLLLPLNTEPLVAGKASVIDNPRVIVLIVMLRLKADQSIEAATEAIRAMQPDILGDGAPTFLSSPIQLVSAEAGTSGAMGPGGLRQEYERPILTLLVGVMFVLVVACLNIANLFLARTTIRNHELSVRVAVGAPRWRLARQWLVESLVTAAIGSALGLLLALWGSRVLVAQLSTSFSQVALNLSLDWRVLGFTAAITIAMALLFGSMPAFRAARVSPIDALRGQGTQSPRRRILNLSSGLVVTQVAVSLVLVVAAGLFGRTFGRLAGELKGFDSGRALVMKVDTARTRVDQASRNRFFHQLVAAAATVPGVADASASIYVPGGRAAGLIFDARGRSTNVGPGRQVVANFVTPRWFSTYGIALRSGRDLGDLDSANGPPVMVVNEAFVHAFLSGRDPIGGALIDADLPFLKGRTVVGVVGDVVYGSPRDAAPPTIYLPLAQSESSWPAGQTAVTIGISPLAGSPASLAPGVATALSAVDRDLAFSFTSLTEQINDSLRQERLMATLSAFFGVLALLLAGLGLYGITAYAVSRRRTEIAIRLALGMPPQSVVTMVIARVATVIGFGLAVGTLASLWLSGFVSSLLYGVEPRDLATLAVAGAVLAAVGMAAGWLPAHRAKRTDPSVLLRSN